jgi:SAM-dependent methyltransferase
MRKMLRNVFEQKVWRGSDEGSRSGPGSTMEATAKLRAALPGVFDRYDVKTFLDAPCGDWNWMSQVNLGNVAYIGGDIAEPVIADNIARFERPGVSFLHLDITSDPLPKADMIMCRDCLFHLKHKFRWLFFENFLASGIPHLMMTMHHLDRNRPLTTNGNYAAFSPMAEPFSFAAPLEMIHETMEALPADMSREEKPLQYRSLGIWHRDAVADAVACSDWAVTQ